MDNMNTMDFNQKIDVSLRASLEATPVERNASDDLSTGSSSDGFWNLIVLYTGSPQTLQNEFPSSSFTFLLGNYAIVKISEDDIPSLAAFPQVIYIERPRQLFFEIVSARQASCLSAIQENSSYGLTGKGILISVIDSGIDYAHPDFCNPDKTTRLVALWDQTILADPSAGRFAPAGYSQGTLFSPEQINAALQADTFEQRMELVPSTDVTGHGTHLAGIAAGYAENLLLRSVDVSLKENRKVVLVPREMPLSRIHLRNMKEAANYGCIIIPPMLTFYNGSDSVDKQMQHIIGKILMQFGIDYKNFVAWKGAE